VQLSLSAGCPKTQSSEHCAIIIILFDTVGYAVKILRVKEKILNLDKNNFLATTCQHSYIKLRLYPACFISLRVVFLYYLLFSCSPFIQGFWYPLSGGKM